MMAIHLHHAPRRRYDVEARSPTLERYGEISSVEGGINRPRSPASTRKTEMQDAKGAGFRLGTESTERTDEAVAAAQGAAVRRTGRGDGSRRDRPRYTGRRSACGSLGEGKDEARQGEGTGVRGGGNGGGRTWK